tara:strand:- start:712 stop:1002 length:291 start_codon:yes stop_codon:yes gene_type:complete
MRALFWFSLLIIVAGIPLIGELLLPEQGWLILGLLSVSSYIGIKIADGMLFIADRTGWRPGGIGAQMDEAAAIACAGFIGGILLIGAIACAGGCAW